MKNMRSGFIVLLATSRKSFGTATDDPPNSFSKVSEPLTPCLNESQLGLLAGVVSDSELKRTLFPLWDDKATSPYEYNAYFFKSTWNITGLDLCAAIKSFFAYTNLLGELNATPISLFP